MSRLTFAQRAVLELMEQEEARGDTVCELQIWDQSISYNVRHTMNSLVKRGLIQRVGYIDEEHGCEYRLVRGVPS